MTDGQPTPEEYVGASIRRLRQAHGWSQEQLAKSMTNAGFKWIQSTVAKTEAAERPIRIGEMIGLARLFEVPAHELFEPRPAVTSDAQADAIRYSHELARVEAEERSLVGRIGDLHLELEKVRERMELYENLLREAQDRYAESLRDSPATRA